METLTAKAYSKLKAKEPKKQINQSNADTCEQMLSELQEIYPALIDMYYMEHLGAWAIRTSDEKTDNEEFETFKELFDFLYRQ